MTGFNRTFEVLKPIRLKGLYLSETGFNRTFEVLKRARRRACDVGARRFNRTFEVLKLEAPPGVADRREASIAPLRY